MSLAIKTLNLTEISAIDFPQSQNYRYKCRIAVLTDDGQQKLEKSLLTRMQPDWLVDVKHKGDFDYSPMSLLCLRWCQDGG